MEEQKTDLLFHRHVISFEDDRNVLEIDRDGSDNIVST